MEIIKIAIKKIIFSKKIRSNNLNNNKLQIKLNNFESKILNNSFLKINSVKNLQLHDFKFSKLRKLYKIKDKENYH